MPVVLGILVILGLLVSVVMLHVQKNNKLARLDHREAQERLLLESALSRFRWQAAHDTSFWRPNWKAERWFGTNRVGYKLDVSAWGLFLQARIRTWTKSSDSTQFRFVVGSSVGGDSVPSFAMLSAGGIHLKDHSSLAGRLWMNGLVEVSNGSHSPTTEPQNWHRATQLLPDKQLMDAWFDTVDSRMRRGASIDSGLAQVTTCGLSDTLQNSEVRCQGTLMVTDAHLTNCLLVADRIELRGRNHLESSLVHSHKTLRTSGILESNSQFLAADSMVLESDSIRGNGVFAVQGIIDSLRFPKAAGRSHSAIKVGKVIGEGLVIWRGRDIRDRDAHFTSESSTKWNGSWILMGGSKPRGALKGLFLTEFVVATRPDGSAWEGDLQEFRVEPVAQPWLGLPWSGRGTPWVLSVHHEP